MSFFKRFTNITFALIIGLIAAWIFFSINTKTYAQTPPVEPVCVNGEGWVSGTHGVLQGKQLSGLPVPLERSSTANAYGPADGLFFSLGRGGWVEYSFSADVKNISGDEIKIYEITNGRSFYPLESAKIKVSLDGILWFPIGKIATSRVNPLGITSINIGETGLSKIRYIRLADVISRDNPYPEADGFDVDAIQALSIECPLPTPTVTPTILPTETPTETPIPVPTSTETPSPTITPTPTDTPTNTPTPSDTPTPTLTPTETLTPTLTLTPSLTPTLTPVLTATPTPSPTLTPTPVALSIDFGTSVSTGSPYVFGGAHTPRPEMTDAWQKLQDVGVTIIRHDFNPDRILPANITLDDYKNNVNDVQNPLRWSRPQIDLTNAIFTQAKNRGMKRIGIMAYIPRWLSNCNCIFGVPTDFAVYKDIVKKVYREHRNNVEYVEIWNEPTHPVFLQPAGSGLTREQAYVKIFNTASEGIREVDAEINDGKRAVIGGLVADSPAATTMLQAIVSDSTAAANLDFISYHAYDKITEPSWGNYKPILAAAGMPNLPIYITEWNYFYSDTIPTPFLGGPESVSYVGRKFIEYLKMGLLIANYHTLEPINTTRPNNGAGTFGFFRWDAATSTATLAEQAKTWRLMSKTLGLGVGQSTIYAGPVGAIPAIGYMNSLGAKGVVLTNEQNTQREIRVTTSNLASITKAKLYQASGTADGSAILNTIFPQANGTSQTWIVTVPPLSVTALVFE